MGLAYTNPDVRWHQDMKFSFHSEDRNSRTGLNIPGDLFPDFSVQWLNY